MTASEIDYHLSNLKSKDHATRATSAIWVGENKIEKASNILISQIFLDENKHHLGFMVAALSKLNCERYLKEIVQIILKFDFEAQSIAFNILSGINFICSEVEKRSIIEEINQFQRADVSAIELSNLKSDILETINGLHQ